MKKKNIFNVIAFLLLAFTFICPIGAEELDVSETRTARAPSAIPDVNDTLYAILDDDFNYSKITFDSSVTGGEAIPGHTYMRKIMLTANPGTGDTKTEKLGESWFTVYCLDGNLKFPMYSYINFTFGSSLPDSVKLQIQMMFALFNNIEFYDLFAGAEGYTFDPTVNYTLTGTQTDASLLAELEAGNPVTVSIQSITYNDDTLAPKTITAADLTKTAGATSYDLTITPADLVFDKYTAKKMTGKDYNHALWILEHSYPTLDINKSLELAGASYDTLLTEIKTLHDGETHTDTEWDAIVENYIYSTVQYAIWKVNGGIDINGNTLGNKLNGSAQLNLLYTYLIVDREIYNNYSSYNFSNTFLLNKPDDGSEIADETDEYYLYGPYSADYDLVSIKDVTISIGNADKSGISLVDEDGNEITTVAPDTKFYVKCLKANKIANVTVTLYTENAITFYPSNNRGRIYYSYYPLSQNVISGGKIVTTNIEKSFDLIFNPKTGVENIAIVFVVALIAFSLGYLALSYKNKPVELN